MSTVFTFGKNGKIYGKAWGDVNTTPLLLEQVHPAGLSPVCRLDYYDESELNMIDECLAKKHGELFTFSGKSYILTHEGRFMCISEVKRIEFDSMEEL